MNDPIVEEVRKTRHEHAKSFGYDLRAIFNDLVQRQNQHQEKLVRLQPKRIVSHQPHRTA